MRSDEGSCRGEFGRNVQIHCTHGDFTSDDEYRAKRCTGFTRNDVFDDGGADERTLHIFRELRERLDATKVDVADPHGICGRRDGVASWRRWDTALRPRRRDPRCR